MNQRSLAALVLLNLALLAALIVTAATPKPAAAQFGPRANYTMLTGAVTGRSNQDAVFIIDLSTGAIAPIFFNGSNNTFEVFRGTIVSEDVKANTRKER
jgi:hypothetical protein